MWKLYERKGGPSEQERGHAQLRGEMSSFLVRTSVRMSSRLRVAKTAAEAGYRGDGAAVVTATVSLVRRGTQAGVVNSGDWLSLVSAPQHAA